MLTKVELAHAPANLGVYVALYQDVKNAAFLREQLVGGNSAFEFAFIDAKSILSPAHLLAAVFRAINDFQAQKMKSRNIHSETVFSLSPNNNIAESFRKFGITDKTNDLVAVKITDSDPEPFQRLLSENVQGKSVAFTAENIAKCSDITFIRKTYKLPLPSQPKADQINGLQDLEFSVLGLMALRGAT